MTELSAETLLTLGFQDIGRWAPARREGGLAYLLDGANSKADGVLLDARNSLYAFVEGDAVRYIGKTARTIRERFTGYRTPPPRQRTNWRNNRDALGAGSVIRILVFNPISFLRYGDFEINLAAGLEDALIEAFDPPWSGRERGRAITEEAEREELDEAEAEARSGDAPQEIAISSPAPTPANSPSGAIAFKIVLGEAYYNQGLINPGAAASTHLGNDGDPIEVAFNDGTEPVLSRIDRRANPSGSVRIVGRNRVDSAVVPGTLPEGRRRSGPSPGLSPCHASLDATISMRKQNFLPAQARLRLSDESDGCTTGAPRTES
jgi:hypothetical protein